MSLLFKVGTKVSIKVDKKLIFPISGIIMGKIKNINSYVVATAVPYETNNVLISKYGFPIRNVELEFGKFNGYDSEFIIDSQNLSIIKE